MTLEEAIKHAEYIASEYSEAVSICWSAKDNRQLAAWLRELQERREKDNKIGRGNARWIISSDGYYPYCSACMAEPKDGKMADICPSCGARMEGKIT